MPPVPSATLGIGIKLVQGLHALHAETQALAGEGLAYLSSHSRLDLEQDSWGWVSTSSCDSEPTP